MKRVELISYWVKVPDDTVTGGVALLPKMEEYNLTDSWSDVTAEDRPQDLRGENIVILECLVTDTQLAELLNCPDCFVMWDEPVNEPEGKRHESMPLQQWETMRVWLVRQGVLPSGLDAMTGERQTKSFAARTMKQHLRRNNAASLPIDSR